MLHVFCNTADVIITKTLLLGDVVEVVVVQVVVGIQHVQSFTCTHPDQATRVFVDLGDVVVGEHLCMGDITCEHPFLRVGEVEYHQSFGSTDIEVVLLVILIIMKGSDGVGIQFTIFTGIRREGVHSGVVNLQTAIGGNPEVTDLIRAERIDMIVDERLHTVLCQGVDGGIAIQNTGQSITLRTDPETAVGCEGHG